MRILMLGWEFPPFKAGGLGTACFGLTRALDRDGHEVLFVLPRPTGGATGEHVTLMGPDAIRPILKTHGDASERVFSRPEQVSRPARTVKDSFVEEVEEVVSPGFERTRFFEIESNLVGPYGSGYVSASGTEREQAITEMVKHLREMSIEELPAWAEGMPIAAAADMMVALDAIEHMDDETDNTYSWDLFGDAERYARIVTGLSQKVDFDVIHAHDWLAYPAGMAVRAKTGRPLVCHMHATEFDRSGEHINQYVYDIERAGVHAADRVIAVSQLTKEVLIGRYGVDPAKIDVVYNGVDKDEDQPTPGARIEREDKIILFLGRITMQKGPEYFIRAAKRALDKMDNIKFVVAGSGDMAIRMIEEAASLGIGHKVLFTGFLRGRDVSRVFAMADCYVMPSVSEPFGIAPLEAIQQGTPVIISKQSGVSEVLTHALKVDFWDIDEMANKMVAVLKYPPLSQTLRQHGDMELRRLTWGDASRRTAETYRRAVAQVHGI